MSTTLDPTSAAGAEDVGCSHPATVISIDGVCCVCDRVVVPRCTERAWCVDRAGHDGPCVEVPRTTVAATDYGPRRKS